MDTKLSIDNRVKWINALLEKTHAKGIIYGNSGGKDCTLVSILAKLATDNVLGVIMPCQSSQNYGSDRVDALECGKQYGIEQIEVDLTDTKLALLGALGDNFSQTCSEKMAEDSDDNFSQTCSEKMAEDSDDKLSQTCSDENSLKMAGVNINPRLRMAVLYALGQARGYLVAGTGNLDEITMGYFTKWGDGACDFNPIADLTVSEVFEHLRLLDAPKNIIEKQPSAGLYQGQTDEQEMGVLYSDIDAYLRGEKIDAYAQSKIEMAKLRGAHKLRMPLKFGE